MHYYLIVYNTRWTCWYKISSKYKDVHLWIHVCGWIMHTWVYGYRDDSRERASRYTHMHSLYAITMRKGLVWVSSSSIVQVNRGSSYLRVFSFHTTLFRPFSLSLSLLSSYCFLLLIDLMLPWLEWVCNWMSEWVKRSIWSVDVILLSLLFSLSLSLFRLLSLLNSIPSEESMRWIEHSRSFYPTSIKAYIFTCLKSIS